MVALRGVLPRWGGRDVACMRRVLRVPAKGRKGVVRVAYKATWKRKFRRAGRKASLLKSSRVRCEVPLYSTCCECSVSLQRVARRRLGCVQGWQGLYLAERIYQLVLESQLPHKIVQLLFTITNQSIKVTILWGS